MVRSMRNALFCLVLLLGLTQAGQTHAQSEADRSAIQGVISHQLQAFQRDDADTAFADASPGIQAQFGTPENFLAMVERGYPPVYRPRQRSFGELHSEDGELIQDVDIIATDGSLWRALYAMEQQPDGSWKISGCQLVRAPSVGA